MSEASRYLQVEKRPFLSALKSLRISVRARQKDEATLSFGDGNLCIGIQNSRVEVPAQGTWSGTVKVVARTLIPIVTFPPDPDPLPLRFEKGRFYIAGWSVNATWHAEGIDELSLPSDASCIDLAALRVSHGDDELERSGLLQDVRNAEQVIKTQITQAAKVLEAAGITEDDLREMVERKIEAIRANTPG